MHLNGFLDVHIVVFRSSFVTIEFLIQIVKVHFDFSTTRYFLLGTTSGSISFLIVLSGKSIFVGLYEIGGHGEEKLLLIRAIIWHFRSKILKIIFCLFCFDFNFVHNVW